jgi:hypothetical protein
MNPIISAVLGGIDINGILGRFFPSKEKAQEFKAQLESELLRQEGEITKAAIAVQQAQIEVNKIEAQSSSLFVAGWRPFIGWVCGSALAWQFVGHPMVTYFINLYAVQSGHILPPLPQLDGDQLYPVLMGMLGLGSMRTFEKLKGVDRSTLKEP